jgi:hypothetical protein
MNVSGLQRGGIHLRPKCVKCHGQARIKGSLFCRLHGGARAITKPTAKALRVRAARKVIDYARRDGRVPYALEAHPAWIRCGVRSLCEWRPEMLAAWHSPDPWAWPNIIQRLAMFCGEDI